MRCRDIAVCCYLAVLTEPPTTESTGVVAAGKMIAGTARHATYRCTVGAADFMQKAAGADFPESECTVTSSCDDDQTFSDCHCKHSCGMASEYSMGMIFTNGATTTTGATMLPDSSSGIPATGYEPPFSCIRQAAHDLIVCCCYPAAVSMTFQLPFQFPVFSIPRDDVPILATGE
jgi:hypothetical protein